MKPIRRCPNCGTLTKLEVCPNCNFYVTGDNKGKDAADVAVASSKSKKK